MRIAVVGSGISGSLTARLLSSQHEVVLYEANRYIGGHANTVDVELDGKRHSVDTGFMVFNRRTYPNFCRLLEILEVTSRPSDMSFSVRSDETGLEYQGSSLNGLFAQRRNVLRPSFLRMLYDVIRFNMRGSAVAGSSELKQHTVASFLKECRLGHEFTYRYLVPMSSAIWSCPPESILEFPAHFLIGFFANHGLMQLRDRPMWRTIAGGSQTYLQALLRDFDGQIRTNTPVSRVTRSKESVSIRTNDGLSESFDEVVMATHADQTLRLLADASADEERILRAFPYHSNDAILHTDLRLLPTSRRAWASWNYQIPDGQLQSASVTYDLSRLQGIDSKDRILLTLNPLIEIDDSKVLRTFRYSHPAYSFESLDAQSQFRQISGRHRTHFCGAYWGFGFHEDGVNSALAVAQRFGIDLNACTVASTKDSSRIAAISR